MRARKARLEHLEGVLLGIGEAKTFNMDEFAERVGPVLEEWRAHLKRNTHVAQQVIRKILPARLKVTPLEGGGWCFEGLSDYRKVLAELGVDAITAVLEDSSIVSKSPWRSEHYGKTISGVIPFA